MLVIKKGKEFVEQDVVISKKHLCDKCGIEITRDTYRGYSMGIATFAGKFAVAHAHR